MNAYPFTLFKRSNRPFYFVSFKDENGRFLSPISTKRAEEKEAMQVAFAWLRDGIPQKKTVVKVNDLSLKDMVRKIKAGQDVETLMAELRRLGWVKSYVQSETPGAVDFISFLKTFWDWDTSPYVKEKLRKSHGIHRRHCDNQTGAVSLYWEAFFKGRFLGDITAADIDDFINYMGEKDLSADRKNGVILAGTKPLRWAFSKGHIDKDPTRGHLLFTGEEHKRAILTPTVASAIFRLDWEDERSKLANMLASVTGMRNSEIRALRLQDIGADCLYVGYSYNPKDGMKLTKNNEARTVEMPWPYLIEELIKQAQKNPWGVSPTSLVFWSTTRSKVPMLGNTFVLDLRAALRKIGLTENEAEKYDFHGWRHFFTSYMIKKLDKRLLKGETGHKTDKMINLYSDHETEGDRQIIQNSKKETFAGLLPETEKKIISSVGRIPQNNQNVLLLEYKGDTQTAVA